MPTARHSREPCRRRNVPAASCSEPITITGAPSLPCSRYSLNERQPARAAPSRSSASTGNSSSTERGKNGSRSISTAAAVSTAPSTTPRVSWRSSASPM